MELREDRQINLEVRPDNLEAQDASAHVGGGREGRDRIGNDTGQVGEE